MPAPWNPPRAPETRPGRPRGRTSARRWGKGAERNRKPRGSLPATGVPTAQPARSRSAPPAPAPPPLREPRFWRRGNGPIAAPAGRVPAAGLARALCGPIVTATQSRGKTQKTQPNGTRQIPKDFWGLDSTPRATIAGPGAAGVIIVPGLLEEKEAQRGSAASEVFEPRPGGPRRPPRKGFSSVRTPAIASPAPAWPGGQCRTAEGPGSRFRRPLGLRVSVSCAQAQSVDLRLCPFGDPRASGSPSPLSVRPPTPHPRRLSGTFEPCP